MALSILPIWPVWPAGAQSDDARLGGGSDIAGGAVVALPAGTRIPPIHFVFADNPESRPIEVEFRAESPRGIEIEPEKTRYTIPPHGKVEARFAIAVAESVAAGGYRVSVQLVRSDIEPAAGRVTNVPAVGARFTVQVAGEAATVVVRAEEKATKRPVEGTLVLSAVLETGTLFEVNRAVASSLTTRVAPGPYRATYLLADRQLATQRIQVKAGEPVEITLAVETVSFVVTAAKAVTEEGRIVVADLVASLENQLSPVSGRVRLQVRVRYGPRQVASLVLRELDVLPLGLTEARTTYRPDGGWRPGTYVFQFELVTPEFTLQAAERPRIDVPGARSVVGLAAIAGGAVAVAVVGYLALRRWRAR